MIHDPVEIFNEQTVECQRTDDKSPHRQQYTGERWRNDQADHNRRTHPQENFIHTVFIYD